MTHTLPKKGTYVILDVEEIISGCELSDTYRIITNLKKRVLDVAVNEIKRVTLYDVSYENVKNGRKIEAFSFYVNMKYHNHEV